MSDAEAAARPLAVLTFIAAIVLIYLLLVLAEGDLDMRAETIAEWGGLLPLRWLEGEYWRFLTAGFLHFGPMHLAANSICLLAWGTPLERMIGPGRVSALFIAAIVIGSLTSVLTHQEVFVGAGASGGTSGLLGALFVLWLTGRVRVPASFFVINIGLNIAIAALAPGIDWQAHLGGFLSGIVLGPLLARGLAR